MFAPQQKIQLKKDVTVTRPMVIQKQTILGMKDISDDQMKIVSPDVITTRSTEDPQERLILRQLGEDDDTDMQVMAQPKAMLGVVLGPVPEVLHDYLRLGDTPGVWVTQVLDDTPAQEAGLEDGDIIVAMRVGKEDWNPASEDSLRHLIADSEPGTVVELKYIRAGTHDKTKVKLSQWDASRMGSGFVGQPLELKELRGLETPDFEGEDLFEWTTPGEGDHHFKIVIDPERINKLIEGFKFDGKLLKEHLERSLPNELKPMKVQPLPGPYREIEEMMDLLEQQMKDMERMFENLHRQQNEINRKLKEAKSRDA